MVGQAQLLCADSDYFWDSVWLTQTDEERIWWDSVTNGGTSRRWGGTRLNLCQTNEIFGTVCSLERWKG